MTNEQLLKASGLVLFSLNFGIRIFVTLKNHKKRNGVITAFLIKDTRKLVSSLQRKNIEREAWK